MDLFQEFINLGGESGAFGIRGWAGKARPYEVRGSRKGKTLEFSLTPGSRVDWLPAMVFSVKLADGQTVSTIELELLSKKPGKNSKSVFDEKDRMEMIAQKAPGIGEKISKAQPFINAQYASPDGVIARLHNAGGALRVGCNFFTPYSEAYPGKALYSSIVSEVVRYLGSGKGRALKASPQVVQSILESGEIISYHSNMKEMGLIDTEVEYGWNDEYALSRFAELKKSSKKFAKAKWLRAK